MSLLQEEGLSPDDRAIVDAAAAYCRRDPQFRRQRALRTATPSFDRQAWREMGELGWIGCRISEADGGIALSFHQLTLILEQCGRSLLPEPLSAVGVIASGLLARSTNALLKKRCLPSLLEGRWIPTLAWQESGDALYVEPRLTTFTACNGGFVIEGRKRVVAVAEGADAYIVSARDATGSALFLVESDAPGLEVQTHRRVDGGTWCEVAFSSVPTDASNMLARGDEAIALLTRAIDEGRLAAGAELVGAMAAVFEMTVDYLKLRRQFGKQIGSFQALQHRAVDLYIQIEISRAVLRQTAALFDTTEDPLQRARAVSQLKARASEAALIVAKGAVQLHGGIAYTDECHVGLFLKRVMVLASWLGNASVHRERHGQLADTLPVGSENGDHTLSPLQRDARAFAEENFPSELRFSASRLSLSEAAPWLRRLHDHGWGAPGWPVEFGGMGLSAYDQIKLQEVFDRHGIFVVPNLGVSMLGPLLLRYGTDAQRQQYLPDIVSGRTRWCQGYSEPGAGSDLASLRTAAVLDGDEFIVNGQKIWTSHASDADMIFMLVRTDPGVKKQDGISFLLADMKSPGISMRPILNIAGESEFFEVYFDNVRVPARNLVGKLNQGWQMAKSLLGSERIMIGSPRLANVPLQVLQGVLRTRGLLDDAATRARFNGLRLDVADQSAAFVRLVDRLRNGGELGSEVSVLKIWITETMQRVTDMLLEVSGDEGVLDEPLALKDGSSPHVAKQYFLSRPATIYAGSNEIQRNILAKAVLELPD